MNAELVRKVWLRARRCCEYCRMPQGHDDIPFEIDHIISKKHGGHTDAGNLGLSCFFCNSFKGSDIGGLDPKTRKLTPLFNPRRNKWNRHFRWKGGLSLPGTASIGRVTVILLNINLIAFRVELREELMDEGLFPRYSERRADDFGSNLKKQNVNSTLPATQSPTPGHPP